MLFRSTLLAAGGYDGSIPGLNTKRALIQSRDNSIIVGDAIYLANRLQSSLNISDAQFHFFSLNPVSGHVNWETNYQFPIPIPLSVTNINNVSELPDGKLAFTSSVSLTGTMQTPAIKKILRITTDNRGRIQNALTYQVPGNKLTELINVMPGNNGLNESFLIRGDTLGAVVNINNSGAITWQQGYSNLNNQFPVNFSASFQNGYAIVMSNFKTHFSKLLLTDGNGQIPCANIPVQLVMDSINMDQGSLLVTDISSIDPNPFAISDFPLHNKSFPLETSTECEEQADCCKDIIDTFNIPNIHICENSTYHLPDGNRVKETGTYFVSFKTSRGCDSIKFYHLYVDKDPLNLKLGNNQCLAGDSLILNATGGFNSYVWMNNPPSADSSFRIFNHGNYHVKVTNSCGTHGDSITVYKECDFPIFLPNSFTPNNDGLNDEFRLPMGNKNHFQSLTIFNRWGQIVFQSNDPFKGWNGSFNHQPLTTDIFIYILVMNGLSGNKITKKGTLLLIR